MDSQNELLLQSVLKHAYVSEEQYELILKQAQRRKYKKGQYVVHEGSIVRKTHFILNGAALAFFIDQSGHEHVIQFATEGWWISDIQNYISGEPALLNVKAIEDCELLEFGYEEIQRLYKEVPPFQTYFLNITQKAFASFQKRVLSDLSLTAEERYIQFIKHYPGLELRFPQKVIASYLGISAEFYSKIRKKQSAS